MLWFSSEHKYQGIRSASRQEARNIRKRTDSRKMIFHVLITGKHTRIKEEDPIFVKMRKNESRLGPWLYLLWIVLFLDILFSILLSSFISMWPWFFGFVPNFLCLFFYFSVTAKFFVSFGVYMTSLLFLFILQCLLNPISDFVYALSVVFLFHI